VVSGMRKDWRIVAALAAIGLAALVGWAWHDGGTEELRAISTPAMLPGEAR